MALEQDSAQGGVVEGDESRRMLIIYGSETGNSEESASDIECMARRLHFHTLLEEMNNVELRDLLRYSLVVFVVSTTGQGDLPKNARNFWKRLLRKRLPQGCLRRLKFTTFGLGDSSYIQYNWAARKLHKRLEQLGASEFMPRGEADERHEDGVDGTFLPWCLTLQTFLEKNYPLPPNLSPIPLDVQLPHRITLELATPDGAMDCKDNMASDHDIPGVELDGDAALFSHVDNTPLQTKTLKLENTLSATAIDVDTQNKLLARASNLNANSWRGGVDTLDRPNVLRDSPTKYGLEDSTALTGDQVEDDSLLHIPGSWVAMVDSNVRLTPESHWQDVRKLSLIFNYSAHESNERQPLPGDTAVIYPKNFPQDVEALIDLMHWGEVADEPIRHVVPGTELACQTPKNCYPRSDYTLRNLLTDNYDITCIPRRQFFFQIASYTKDPTHKQRLRDFADPRRSDEFYDYTSRPRRSILEILQDFPSVRIPYQHVPGIFPTIRGREYSIASPAGRVANYNCLGIDLVVALVKYKTVLRKTRQGLCSRYIAALKPGQKINLSFTSNPVPKVLLKKNKPIIAIATGTGIAPIRALLHHRAPVSNWKDNETLLFFGGRNAKADFFFREEYEELGIKVITAFSRDQPAKCYVQDRIKENYKLVCEFMQKGCAVLLCGSSGKMPECVRASLYDAMCLGGLAENPDQAKTHLHESLIYWEEVW
ncbi:riboflavin synthase domain-like protein [Astrocystis sublimbata]|nr:riboflavin synthase domain-like protein [Astrocystis sublimbata]